MVSVHRAMVQQGLRSRMILQVHDELLFDIYLPEKETVERLVRSHMENTAILSVPLEVSIGFGNNWLEAH